MFLRFGHLSETQYCTLSHQTGPPHRLRAGHPPCHRVGRVTRIAPPLASSIAQIHFLIFVPESVELEGRPDLEHHLDGDEEELVGLCRPRLRALPHQEMVRIGRTGLHRRHTVFAVLQDVVGDVIVHIIEAPFALEERVGEVLVFRPILVPEKRDRHPEIPRAGEAVLRIGVEIPHGVTVESWGKA